MKVKETVMTKQVAFRLPVDLVEKLDREADRLTKETVGMQITRADVVRRALLEWFESQKGTRSPRRVRS